MSDKINKIARLAFDPSAQEGEAIAAFLKLRALNAESKMVNDHVQKPREHRQESTSRDSSMHVAYKVPHQVLADYLELCRRNMKVSFGTSVKIRITPVEEEKWEVRFICAPGSYAEVRATCEAIFQMWTNRSVEEELRRREREKEDLFRKSTAAAKKAKERVRKFEEMYTKPIKKKSFWDKIWS